MKVKPSKIPSATPGTLEHGVRTWEMGFSVNRGSNILVSSGYSIGGTYNTGSSFRSSFSQSISRNQL